MNHVKGPLDGTVVIDVTAGLAGPYATFLLAGMGARVIKIEMPHEGDLPPTNRNSPPYIGREGVSMVRKHADDMSISTLQRMRGVESITLDLKSPEGRQIFLDLVRKAEVVFENRARGALARIGCGFADAIAVNPAIVYTSLSGTGQDDKSGSGKMIDTVVQAMSGLMMTSGSEGEPPMRNGVPLADLVTPIYAAMGTLAALLEARKTGKGQHVDVSMLGAITTLVANDHFPELADLGFPIRTGPTVPRISPLGVYPTSDGHVAICTVSDARFYDLARIAGMPELITDPRFAKRPERTKNYREIDEIVSSWTRKHTAAEVASMLDAAGIPSGEVRSPRDALEDPRGLARGDVVPLKHPAYGQTHSIYGPGIPVKFGDRTYPEDAVVPALGQHNASVYGDLLDYSAEKVAQLARDGVI